ncbi:hypothetical protein [Streptomyces xanthophaeus]|uniref:Uncharacterized protein n=1 Tax=Streptomyces xanthophaeus TaxID=67385 RepID=A0A919GTV6_9ACTN|nr:hypothetical protein [Streptomyces xanthophaeus]WST21277.1 hypothetical protein OG264_07075 [Streptomyces xanthophaeus]WST63735.1 hypothetical protein OG605_31285 [Streptomyces xanthophaeus]GHI84090.1 hypothetical protein Sxan_14540 [Streptomyces xanthophaeus]
MTTAEHLERIDRLRVTQFPPEPVRSGGQSSGPGYHLVQVGWTADFREDGGAGRAEAADQIGAEYGALTQALAERWGEPQVFALTSVLDRGSGGEEIPEPWGELSGSTSHVHAWRAGEQWLVVWVVDGGAEDAYVLMAGVTVVDPP